MGSLVAACMRDLVPRPGIKPGPPTLGTWCLTHWATGEVPLQLPGSPEFVVEYSAHSDFSVLGLTCQSQIHMNLFQAS